MLSRSQAREAGECAEGATAGQGVGETGVHRGGRRSLPALGRLRPSLGRRSPRPPGARRAVARAAAPATNFGRCESASGNAGPWRGLGTRCLSEPQTARGPSAVFQAGIEVAPRARAGPRGCGVAAAPGGAGREVPRGRNTRRLITAQQAPLGPGCRYSGRGPRQVCLKFGGRERPWGLSERGSGCLSPTSWCPGSTNY